MNIPPATSDKVQVRDFIVGLTPVELIAVFDSLHTEGRVAISLVDLLTKEIVRAEVEVDYLKERVQKAA